PDGVGTLINCNSLISLETVACVTFNSYSFKRFTNSSCVSIFSFEIISLIFICLTDFLAMYSTSINEYLYNDFNTWKMILLLKLILQNRNAILIYRVISNY